jgi:triosephosphate isomerase (TIM)
MLFVNFKTYEEGTGANALKILSVLEKISHDTQIKIVPVLQSADIKEAVQVSKLEIWAQHVDAVEYGAHTGATIPEAVVEDGASGTFLNHSEHKFTDFDTLTKAFNRAKEVGLKTLVFAADIAELNKIIALSPTYVAYEPPELVGSQTTSVSESKPEVIEEAVKIAREKSLPLIVGAGIKSRKDVEVSVQLGASGIAVASDIIKAEDPGKETLELIDGFNL